MNPTSQTLNLNTDKDDIFKFVAKSDKNKIVGYEVENVSNNLGHVLNHLGLNRKQKLAVCLSYIRERQQKTQKEFSVVLGISESTYKSLERAEHNISFDTLDVIYDKFQKRSFA